MRKIMVLLFILSTYFVIAQSANTFSDREYNFTDNGVQITPQIDYTRIYIVFDEDVSANRLSQFENDFDALRVDKERSFPWANHKRFMLSKDISQHPEKAEAYLARIRQSAGIQSAYPAFIRDADIAFLDNCFLMNLKKEDAGIEKVQKLIGPYHGVIAEEIHFVKSTIYVIEVPAQVNIFTVCTLLDKKEIIRYAQPNFQFTGISKIVPNDPMFSDQWFLDQTSDADIDAVEAWDITTGSSSTMVAIIDGHGYDMNHSEMVGKYISPYDAVNDNNDPNATHSEENHGTPCSGLIGALTNNSVGVASIGYNTMVIPIKMGFDYGSGGTFQTNNAILVRSCEHVMISSHAVVAVSNSYSMGSWANTATIRAAYSDMRTDSRGGKGAVVLASTGNDDAFNSVAYPFHFANVVGVGSTDRFDDRSSFSNYGDSTDIAAPGSDTWTIDRSGFAGYSSGDYYEFSGTSASCPLAAGVIGLMGAVFPDYTEFQLRTKLYNSCDKVGGYSYGNNSNYPYSSWSTQLGYGRINAFEAVQGGSSTLNPPTNIAASVSGNNVHLSWMAPGGGGGSEEELIYDNNVSTGSYKFPGYTMATHMSPSGPCQVLTLKYYTTIETGDNQFYAKVFNWAGAQPGTTVLHNSTQTAQNGAWVEVDVSGSGLNVTEDFVVGFGSFTEEAYLGYDSVLNNGRSWDFQESTSAWSAWTEAYLIRAVVLYPSGKIAELEGSIPETEVRSTEKLHRTKQGQEQQSLETLPNQYKRLLGLLGYKVYRNGTALNSSPVSNVYYDDNGLAPGTYNYTVTAWYDEGESNPAGPVGATIGGSTLDPPTNLETSVNGNTVNLSWVSPGGGGTEEWISYNDGIFENSFASTDGGQGLAQLFTLTSYPVTLTEFRYYTSGFGSFNQAISAYVLSGDGNTILGGPYTSNGVFDNWISFTSNVIIGQSSFMIATINDLADGPYVGVDDSFFDHSLFFGSPTAGYTDLWELNNDYSFVGSHEAKVLYQNKDGNLATSWLRPGSGQAHDQSPAIHIEKDPEMVPYPESGKALLGFNIYRDGSKLNSSVWSPVTYSDPGLAGGTYSYTVTAVYDEGASNPAGPVQATVSGSGLEVPTNLSGNLSGDVVALHWQGPGGGGAEEELIYDNNIATSGYNYPGYTMATQMSPSGPCKVLSLKFFTSIDAGDNTFYASVFNWTGSQPGNNFLYDNEVTAIEGWLEVDITSENLFVDGDFVVGFGSVNETTFQGFDENLNNGRSWDREDASGSWSSWTEAYVIRAVVEYTDGSVAEIGGKLEKPLEHKSGFNKTTHPKGISSEQVTPIDNQLNNLMGFLGYNLYRNNQKINTSLIPGKSTTDQLPGWGVYNYNVSTVFDEGESAFSNTATITYTFGLEEFEKIDVEVYPNPATDKLYIQSYHDIHTIKLVGIDGKKVFSEEIGNKEYQMDVSILSKGLYILYVETELGKAASKILVQ